MQFVSVFMDVEDPVNPLADDAALEFGELFTRAGVTGSFCVTGEKCRTLIERGRADVIVALLPHAHGLHTDTHSFHPSTMEMLADCEFESGCELALGTEGRGRAAFVEAFGLPPGFWGGAGNSWSPEITDALKRLEIPAYAYALTSLPNEAVHRFNGVVGLPQAVSISETDWMDDGRAASAANRALARLKELKQPWVGIFVGHPTKMRYLDYWDKPYYAGRTPPQPEFAEPVPEAAYARAKWNLAEFLRRLSDCAQVIPASAAVAHPWTFRPPTGAEKTHFVEQTSANLRSVMGWPIHRPGLDPENIVRKTMWLADTLEVAELPGHPGN